MGQLAVSLDAPQLKDLHWARRSGKRWQTRAETNGNGATTMISGSPSSPALENSHVSTVSGRTRFY
jgi:hypothetical protein